MEAKAVVPFRPRDDLDLQTLGSILSKSGFFEDAKQAAQAITKILAGRELGIGPIASMTGIYVVKGRITLSAALIASLVKRSGRYDYRVEQLDAEGCELVFLERGKEAGRSKFTRKDAESAGLWGRTEPWRQFPRNMLFARCMSNGARWYCADIFSGPVYTPEELGAALDGESGQPMVDLRTGEVVAEPAPERPPAVVKVLAFWHAECEHARADGIEPAERDFDRATEDELRQSAIRLTRLRAAAEQAGWPDIVHDAYELGLDPPFLGEMTSRNQLAAVVAAWKSALSARREERAEAGEEGPAPEALKQTPADDDDEEDIPVPF
jgi:hypothetical protein